MDEEMKQKIALFKFSLIAPLVNDTHDRKSKAQYVREVAAGTYELPTGVRVQYSASTIKSWWLRYKRDGFDALLPKNRKDAGMPRSLDEKAIVRIGELKKQYPNITGKLIHQKMIEEGVIRSTTTSVSSILRFLRENDFDFRKETDQAERKAFEMEFANQCWQADASHGPRITVDGTKRKTYIIACIDDASRMAVHAELFFADNAINVQSVLKKAMRKFGIPTKLFVDNGSSLKNEQLQLICASLGIVYINSRARVPESRGKVERFFRTIKDNWMHVTDWNDFDSLEALNESFEDYLKDRYVNAVHSSLNQTPRERFLKDIDRIKYLPPETLDRHFLHRVERKVNGDATVKLHGTVFETPQKYVGNRISIRYSPLEPEIAYIFNKQNEPTDTIRPVRKVDNSKMKRNALDYTKMEGE